MCHCYEHRDNDKGFFWHTVARKWQIQQIPEAHGAERELTLNSSSVTAMTKSPFIDRFAGKWREYAGDSIKKAHN